MCLEYSKANNLLKKLKMKLNYLNKIVKQNIDINELRPNKSYDHLVLNRNGHLSNLI